MAEGAEGAVAPAAGVDGGPSDDRVAGELAERAGELLLALRAELGHGDAAALRDAGDRRSHLFITGELARLRPGDAVLSEEGTDDPARLRAERVWIVDPLDGTREYGEEGREDWAVHVALWERGALSAGAVALPAQGVTLTAGAPPPPSGPAGAPVRIAVSRSRPPALVDAVCRELGAVAVPIGSAGAKIAAVVRGSVDAYLHAGGQYEWDSAAPVAVARAAGLHCSRIDGSELTYNQADVRLPDILVCRPELAGPLLQAVAGAPAPRPTETRDAIR
ncbi:3'(2'),5'-bisphosphate nucleotidase CysQ [Allonocardiopsis opalescens]|uniref:3'(2'),5'-bisphosphate nucleotidase n=1 Tax=Allonocardiopsis opalescens TaxID=1144618 RepID=A0A2T0QDA4_9ACTN|nr:3'(2'),5'-bisphosphate nucleotidase CysQ [Allonocardiopsis opalescens]PRY01833.1 3'(2'),5'-bisphosphate nucleotidase [Allonocardiopsis opalescens]